MGGLEAQSGFWPLAKQWREVLVPAQQPQASGSWRPPTTSMLTRATLLKTRQRRKGMAGPGLSTWTLVPNHCQVAAHAEQVTSTMNLSLLLLSLYPQRKCKHHRACSKS